MPKGKRWLSLCWRWQGDQGLLGFWQGPNYPNASSVEVNLNPGCPEGCLFNVREDKEERNDRKEEEPAVFQRLMGRLLELERTVWDTNTTLPAPAVRNGSSSSECYTDCLNKTEYHRIWRGFRGPACFFPGGAPTVPPQPPSPRRDPAPPAAE